MRGRRSRMAQRGTAGLLSPDERPLPDTLGSDARMHLKPLALALLLALLACQPTADSPKAIATDQVEPGRSVQLEPAWRVTDSLLVAPVALKVLGTTIVVADAGASPRLWAIDLASHTPTGRLGTQGRGPCEFESPDGFLVGQEGDEVGVFDFAGSRVTYVQGEWFSEGDGQYECSRTARTVTLGGGGTVFSPVQVGNGGFVAGGLFPDARLVFLDSAGRVERYSGELPPNDFDAPVPVLQHAYQATLIAQAGGGRLAAVSRHSSLLELFTSDGRLIRHTHGPVPVEPNFTVSKQGDEVVFASGDSLRFGYIAAAADSERVYALFSGRARFETPGRANLGDRIHVFDWEGRFEMEYRIEGGAINLALDPSSEWLYVTQADPEPAVVAYHLERMP